MQIKENNGFQEENTARNAETGGKACEERRAHTLLNNARTHTRIMRDFSGKVL